MTWDDYYEKINEWEISTAIRQISSIENIGDQDELVEVLNVIGLEDEAGADKLLKKALKSGIKLSGSNLTEIVDVCTEASIKKALYQSADMFTVQDLEDLYGFIDDELIIQIAKLQKITLPEDLCEEDDDKEDDIDFQFAIDAADCALECLEQAKEALHESSNASFVDMITKGVFTSLYKYSSLTDADMEIQDAKCAIADLNEELQNLRNHKYVKLKYSRLATVLDMCIDDEYLDALTHLRINKVQKQIEQTIKQVKNIKRLLLEYDI